MTLSVGAMVVALPVHASAQGALDSARTLVVTRNLRLRSSPTRRAGFRETLAPGTLLVRLDTVGSTRVALVHVRLANDSARTGWVSWRYVRPRPADSTDAGVSAIAPMRAARPAGVRLSCPGEYRWAVKTMGDDAANDIRARARRTTIRALTRLARPGHVDTKIRNAPVELTRFTVEGLVVQWKQEDDQDLHLVLADPDHPTSTLVAEIPNAQCATVRSSPEADLFERARATVIDALGTPSNSRFKDGGHVRVRVSGVTFFDKIAHGEGHAPNGVELHPVLHIVFLR